VRWRGLVEHDAVSDPGEPEPRDDAPGDAVDGERPPRDAGGPDGIADGLRDARPDHGEVAAALSHARIAAKLFGVTEVVRIGRYEVESRAGAGGGGEVFVAHDPELSRRVAIKLMRGDGGDRDRLLAEGQALARLSHPNIVPVYDAGTLGDQVYVVMELVEGDTLRGYCEAQRRSVREIVRAYRQAAEGLAAAHRAGFIHRDFKPDNALVGRDGRVRVVDFGLARSSIGALTGAEADADADAASPVHVTRAGLGTPRYMAPEQAAHAVLTPAADQYAFCASLREGVLARAPGVPRWLDAILRRGMATDPAARYPSMAAVHAALGRDPAWRWRRRGAAAGVLVTAVAAFGVGRTDRETGPACDTAAAELAATWGPLAAAQTATHLATLTTPYARQAAPRVVTTLDDYAARWRAGFRAACVAHRDGAQSAALYDRRAACLSRARAALDTGVAVVREVTAAQLAAAISALAELPDLARCADVTALISQVAPPPPTTASAVAAATNQLASLEVEVRAARPGVRPRIDRVIARARLLSYPPLVARALRLAGVAALEVDARSDAVPLLDEATNLALTAGDMPLAVEAFARWMFASAAIERDKAGRAADRIAAIALGLPAAELATRVLLENTRGNIALTQGRRGEARAAFERALRLARDVTGPARIDAAGVWSNVALTIDDPGRRRALAAERIAIVEPALGARHPRVLAARISAAQLETDRQLSRDQLAPPCDLLAELQPEHRGEIITCQYQLGWLAFERGDARRAHVAFTRAVASERPGVKPSTIDLARAHLDLLADRTAEAARRVDAVRAAIGPLDQATWFAKVDAADAMMLAGTLARQAGRPDDARAAFDDARRTLEAVRVANDLPRNARRLAFARASLVRISGPGPLAPEARSHATAAIAWYRAAGGYDDVIAELERALAH
jgi:eukaryotic-like serine/threonine-protein kinase